MASQNYNNYYDFTYVLIWSLFFYFTIKYIKKQKFSALDNVESQVKRCGCVDIIGQVSLVFLFLDVLTRNLRIIIFTLPTNWPDMIVATDRTTNN